MARLNTTVWIEIVITKCSIDRLHLTIYDSYTNAFYIIEINIISNVVHVN